VYSGDSSFNTNTSPVLTQTVTQASTTVALNSSTNPTVFGQSVTFTAAVSPVAPATGTPTGTVTFKDGATPLATNALDGTLHATFTLATLSATSHSLTALYNGDPN